MNQNHTIPPFLFCCLLFLTAPGWGQLEDKIVVSKVFTFHTGDDSVWAQPDYDDSHWRRVRKFPRDRWQGIGWFRFVVEVDSSLWNVPLGLSMLYAGAIEFYVDGERLQQFGTVGMSEETEAANVTIEAHPSLRIILFPKPLGGTVEGKSRHVVAFRYSSFLLKSHVWSGAEPGWNFHIGDLEQMRSQRDKYRRRVTIHQMLLMGIFLAFALLHLLLFAFYPKQRDNLYFAGLTASAALAVYFWFQSYFVRDATQVLWVIRLQFIAFIPYVLFLIRFTYSLIYARRPRTFILFCLLGSALAVWCWLRPILAVPYVWVFCIAANVEVVRTLTVAWFRKRELYIEGGWIILLGTIPLLVTGIYSLLGALEIVPEPWDFYDFPTSFYAVLVLIISMSVFLARNFAQTSKVLEAKLVQVQELSEKTLQQKIEQARLKQELELEHIQAEKLQEIDRMKSRFFANISHEFRTPLTLILGPLEKLLSEKFQEPVKKQFRVMLRNGRRLLRLINQLLDLSKLEAGSMALKARPENIISLLKGIVLSFSSLAERKKINLKFEAAEDQIIVYVDRDKLEKIV
ncbi:MAG: sensor histidine kinase, partial [bacterium]